MLKTNKKEKTVRAKSSAKANKKEKKAKQTHLGNKILAIFSVGLLVTIIVLVSFISSYAANTMKDDFANSCSYNIHAIENFRDTQLEDNARIATNISTNVAVAEAVNNMSTYIIEDAVSGYVTDGITDIAVIAKNGKVLYSSNPVLDSIAQKGYINEAINGVSDNFLDIVGDHVYMVSIAPVKYVSNVGVVVVVSRLDNEAELDNLKNSSGADYTVFNGNLRVATTVVDAAGARQVGTTMSDAVNAIVIGQGQPYAGEAVVVGQNYIVNYVPISDRDGAVIGALFTGKSLVGVEAQTKAITLASVIIGAVLFIVCDLVIFIFVRKKIVAPLKRIVEFASEVAEGNLGIRQELDNSYHYDKNDEIGLAFAAVDSTVTSIHDYIEEIDTVLTDLSNCDLTTPVVKDYKGDFISIRDALIKVQGRLIDSMGEINDAAGILANSANEIAASSQSLAQGATEQAGSVQELNATVEDIYHNVKANAENAQAASTKTVQVGEAVNLGNQKVQEMIASMNEINDASSKIEKIIKTIEDIAFQTNILALNAAVEAARAGAAGKGFAVVADEVRNLAGKSAEAAKNTTDLIQNSLRVVAEGSEKADETAEVMRKVVSEVESVVTTIASISEANEEQAVALGQIQSGMTQIAQVVHTTSASAEESAATAEELSAQAKLLEQLVANFRMSR